MISNKDNREQKRIFDRKTKTLLSQHRSGYSIHLYSYLACIKPSEYGNLALNATRSHVSPNTYLAALWTHGADP